MPARNAMHTVALGYTGSGIMEANIKPNWRRYAAILGALVLAGLVFALYISSRTREAAAVAHRFMDLAIQKDSESMSGYLTDQDLYHKYKNDFLNIHKFSECGHGLDPDGTVTIHYYIKGLPADDRNISFRLRKTGSGWIINFIHVNYHIHRDDKALANLVAEWLVRGDRQKLKRYLSDYSDADLDRVFDRLRGEKLFLRTTRIMAARRYETGIRRIVFHYSNRTDSNRLSFRIKYHRRYFLEDLRLD